MAGTGPTAYLTNWKLEDHRIKYPVKIGQAGSWNVEAEVAASTPVRLQLKVGDQSRTVEIPATGGALAWQHLPLGRIDLPASEAVIGRIARFD